MIMDLTRDELHLWERIVTTLCENSAHPIMLIIMDDADAVILGRRERFKEKETKQGPYR